MAKHHGGLSCRSRLAHGASTLAPVAVAQESVTAYLHRTWMSLRRQVDDDDEMTIMTRARWREHLAFEVAERRIEQLGAAVKTDVAATPIAQDVEGTQMTTDVATDARLFGDDVELKAGISRLDCRHHVHESWARVGGRDGGRTGCQPRRPERDRTFGQVCAIGKGYWGDSKGGAERGSGDGKFYSYIVYR